MNEHSKGQKVVVNPTLSKRRVFAVLAVTLMIASAFIVMCQGDSSADDGQTGTGWINLGQQTNEGPVHESTGPIETQTIISGANLTSKTPEKCVLEMNGVDYSTNCNNDVTGILKSSFNLEVKLTGTNKLTITKDMNVGWGNYIIFDVGGDKNLTFVGDGDDTPDSLEIVVKNVQSKYTSGLLYGIKANALRIDGCSVKITFEGINFENDCDIHGVDSDVCHVGYAEPAITGKSELHIDIKNCVADENKQLNIFGVKNTGLYTRFNDSKLSININSCVRSNELGIKNTTGYGEIKFISTDVSSTIDNGSFLDYDGVEVYGMFQECQAVVAFKDGNYDNITQYTTYDFTGVTKLKCYASEDPPIPELSITSPEDGTTLYNPVVKIAGTATEGSTVEINIDGELETTITIQGTTFEYDATLSYGQHHINVVATKMALSNSVDVDFECKEAVAPSLDITSPTDGSKIESQSITVTGTTDGVKVEIFVNNVSQGEITLTGGTFSKDVTLSDGANTIKVVATSSTTGVTEKTINVTVEKEGGGETSSSVNVGLQVIVLVILVAILALIVVYAAYVSKH